MNVEKPGTAFFVSGILIPALLIFFGSLLFSSAYVYQNIVNAGGLDITNFKSFYVLLILFAIIFNFILWQALRSQAFLLTRHYNFLGVLTGFNFAVLIFWMLLVLLLLPFIFKLVLVMIVAPAFGIISGFVGIFLIFIFLLLVLQAPYAMFITLYFLYKKLTVHLSIRYLSVQSYVRSSFLLTFLLITISFLLYLNNSPIPSGFA